MANMFIVWGKFQHKAGTVSITGGDRITQGVDPRQFPIFSLNWGATREVTMDVGDGRNRDKGMSSMKKLTFSREMDRASEYLISRMYVPGHKGDLVNILVTKPDREGKGAVVYLQIQLQGARLVDYCLNLTEGDKPIENLAAIYNKIIFQHWNEDVGGNLEPGCEVGFDLLTGVSTSHADVVNGG
ncbi:type VI secretion system tube protein Hcp [Endozoicomonas gorgoniicola]|uniref:Type VI secretion system tube protein Hcp n=1 Tax=Endozoicomonas gorgoniicola TaxID=1234144 RepID=A0ABT3N3H5_9GAMM|nr:type VI secretion system tube protein Hcp [Endozoicomonas gorgoniicola]MCW7556164.1 type VI secretion system tube protein Hcp [Endozoicomonas gorgoniicola]